MRSLSIACALCIALLAGCDGPKLPKSWRITYARVLAVRSEVVGDESRATPEPGERARARILIVGEEPIERLSYALLACPAGPPRGELPSCDGEARVFEGELLGPARLDREIVLEVDVPAEDELEGIERFLLAGTVCADGSAEQADDASEGRCAGSDAEPVSFVAHIALARGEDEHNHNPVLTDDAIRFDDDVWPPHALASLPGDDDAGIVDEDIPVDAGTPDAGELDAVEADGEEHEIEISLQDSDPESFEGAREELLLSHFVTLGILERRFSVLERGEDIEDPQLVKWRLPERDDLPPHMLAVFVLRDQRGGVSYALRRLEID